MHSRRISETTLWLLCACLGSRMEILMRPNIIRKLDSSCTPPRFGKQSRHFIWSQWSWGWPDCYPLGSHSLVLHFSALWIHLDNRKLCFTEVAVHWENTPAVALGMSFLSHTSLPCSGNLAWYWISYEGHGSKISMGSENLHHQDNITSELRPSLSEAVRNEACLGTRSESNISSLHLLSFSAGLIELLFYVTHLII